MRLWNYILKILLPQKLMSSLIRKSSHRIFSMPHNLHSSKEIEKTLARHGFYFISQKGSHQKFRKDGNPTLTAIVPANKKEIPYGTFKSIVAQSQLLEEDFY